jgi:hypothetical protein
MGMTARHAGVSAAIPMISEVLWNAGYTTALEWPGTDCTYFTDVPPEMSAEAARAAKS